MIYRDIWDPEYENDRKKYAIDPYTGPFFIKNDKIFLKVKPLGTGSYGFADLFCEKDGSEKIVIKTILVFREDKDEDSVEEDFKSTVNAAKHEQKLHKIFSKGKYGDIYGDKTRSLVHMGNNEISNSHALIKKTDDPSLVEKSRPNCYGIRISMNYVEGERFEDYIKKVTNPHRIIQLLFDIIKKVQHLRNTAKVMHGDPSFKNIIINSAGKIKLIDFGSYKWTNKPIDDTELKVFLEQELYVFSQLLDFTAKNCGITEVESKQTKQLLELKSVLEILSASIKDSEINSWDELQSLFVELRHKFQSQLPQIRLCLFHSNHSAHLIKLKPPLPIKNPSQNTIKKGGIK